MIRLITKTTKKFIIKIDDIVCAALDWKVMQISKKVIFGSMFLVVVVAIAGTVIGGQLGQPKPRPYWYQAHEGECLSATQFDNIDRVILYLDLDFQSEFSDVPGLTQEKIANGFSVVSRYRSPSPFLYCLKHADIKTKVVFEKPTESFGRSDLVLYGKVFRSTVKSLGNREFLNVRYQIVWPLQKDEYKSSTMYQEHDTNRILDLINDRFVRYMLEQMGYVEPIMREGHYNVH